MNESCCTQELLDYILGRIPTKPGRALVKSLREFLRMSNLSTIKQFQETDVKELMSMWRNMAPELRKKQLFHRYLRRSLAIGKHVDPNDMPIQDRWLKAENRKNKILPAERYKDLATSNGVPPDKLGVFEGIIKLSGRRTWHPHNTRILAEMLKQRYFMSLEDLSTWDYESIRRNIKEVGDAAGIHPHHRKGMILCLHNCKMNPIVDVSGRYRSHLHKVPSSLMEKWPEMWRLPVWIVDKLNRFVFKTEYTGDMELLIAIAGRLCDTSILNNGNRKIERVLHSAMVRFWNAIRSIMRSQRGVTLIECLSCIRSKEEAILLISKAIAASLRRRSAFMHTQNDGCAKRDEKMLSDFVFLIRSGIFEGQGLRSDTVIRINEVRKMSMKLELEDPQQFASCVKEPEVILHYKLTKEDVERIYNGCRTLEERAVIALLAESGFRAGAIGKARINDVWDREKSEVHQVVGILEKFSKVRRIIPSPRLREALREYILSKQPFVSEWLFPKYNCPLQPSEYIANSVVRVVCERVGLKRVSPHTFRRWVVNEAMRNGNSLEIVARWLGHSCPSVTRKSYWTDDVLQLEVNVPLLDVDAHSTSTDRLLVEKLNQATTAIQELRGQVAHLKAELAAARGDQTNEVNEDSDADTEVDFWSSLM